NLDREADILARGSIRAAGRTYDRVAALLAAAVPLVGVRGRVVRPGAVIGGQRLTDPRRTRDRRARGVDRDLKRGGDEVGAGGAGRVGEAAIPRGGDLDVEPVAEIVRRQRVGRVGRTRDRSTEEVATEPLVAVAGRVVRPAAVIGGQRLTDPRRT